MAVQHFWGKYIKYIFKKVSFFLKFGKLFLNRFGLLYIYFPETEGRTNTEIEHYFADGDRKLTDRCIKKFQKQSEETNTPAQGFDYNAFNKIILKI